MLVMTQECADMLCCIGAGIEWMGAGVGVEKVGIVLGNGYRANISLSKKHSGGMVFGHELWCLRCNLKP